MEPPERLQRLEEMMGEVGAVLSKLQQAQGLPFGHLAGAEWVYGQVEQLVVAFKAAGVASPPQQEEEEEQQHQHQHQHQHQQQWRQRLVTCEFEPREKHFYVRVESNAMENIRVGGVGDEVGWVGGCYHHYALLRTALTSRSQLKTQGPLLEAAHLSTLQPRLSTQPPP